MKRSFLFLFLLLTSLAFAKEDTEFGSEKGYTINYNNVSIVEYVRFVSKITGVNFIFNEEELNFPVTVVSEDPISGEHVMSTLVQVLRVHGLQLLEENNNLLIHKNPAVKQFAHLVFDGEEIDERFPITTRVFRLKERKAEALAAIVRPMISTEAILDTSNATNQIIITDVTPNVEKVQLLIENLDSPTSAFTIDAYHIKHNKPEFLINMANQIMAPLSQGNPYILVPQPKAHVIFVVSTPSLVEKTITVLTNLDTEPKKEKLDLNPENIFIYKVKGKKLGEVERGLKEIAQNIQKGGYAEKGLVETLENFKVIRESNSLLFTGDVASLAKVREILNVMDVPSPESVKESQESFFLYMPLHKTPETVARSVEEVIDHLSKSKLGDRELVETLESVRVVHSTQSVVFTGDPSTFPRVKEILRNIDIPGQAGDEGKSFFIYNIQNIPATQLEDFLKGMASHLERSGVKEKSLVKLIHSMKYIPDTNSILFTGGKRAIAQIKEVLPTIDTPAHGQKVSSQFFIYKPKFLKGDEIYKALKEYKENLGNSGLVDSTLLRTIDSMKWNKSTNSLIFTGDPASLQKISGLISTIDGPSSAPGHDQGFFVHQLQYAPKAKVKEYLDQVASTIKKEGLPEQDLVKAIESMKWIQQSHSYMFTGSQNALNRIKVILTDFDVPNEKALSKAQPTFVLYKLQNIDSKEAGDFLNQVAGNLNRTNEKQDNLFNAIESKKWIEKSHSYMFSGTQDALNEVQELLKAFDTPGKKGYQQSFFTYQLQFVSKSKFENYLKNLGKNLKKSEQDPALVDSIGSMKWIPDSRSFLFSGTEASLNKLKGIITGYDTSAEKDASESYQIYKLKFARGDEIEDDLERFSKTMKESGMEDSRVVRVIDNMKWVKATNSILLTGDPEAVKEVIFLIEQYDVEERPERVHSDFFMYKPVNMSAEALEKAMLDISENLSTGGLVDKGLISSIRSVKFSDETKALIFTGSPSALQKVENLIKEIDIPSAGKTSIQRLGRTTFLLYKLKYASGTHVMDSVENVEKNLKNTSDPDRAFLEALKSMKYVRETNSLLFTGSEAALKKVQTLVEKFDDPSLVERSMTPSEFYIYRPQYVAGPKLETLLVEFADHLKDTGLSDPELFQTIHTMKYIAKSGNLVFTGDEKSLAKVKELLKTFDVAGGEIAASHTEIQEIDNTSFLVFKLQYHKGSEIQAALQQIGKDLIKSKSTVNKGLLNAIHSLQWIEITNSLLCTGDQNTLARLKELIRNLDVPLKQVFIEVLAIETTLSNFLDFGLNWGSKVKYKDRFAASTSNFNQAATSQNSTPAKTFSDTLSNIDATTTPEPKGIPFATGFDLGVIGDMIFHKGRSFVSLGSLLNALQIDNETSILLTPKILAQDSKTSNLFVGQNIPFIGSFVNNTGSNATVETQNVEYRDIGVNMTITPVLGNSDIVTMDINIENTVVPTDAQGQSTNVSVGGITAITTNKTSMQTTVHVPNESFLILSGMMDISKTRTKNQIPCLGGIPLIGAAFSLLNKVDNRNNIVIFIRPHIINSYDDIKAITEEQETIFREETGTPFLENEFDESMELIKSVDDD